MSDPSPPSSAEGAPTSTTAEGDAAPKKRRRRRRRGGRNKKPSPAEQTAAPADATTSPSTSEPTGGDPSLAALAGGLAGGLLSHIDDRQVPCASERCKNTWTWSAAEQIQAYGQPPPRRECASCAKIANSEVRCSVDGCKRTWTWSREAQLKHRAWSKRRDGGGGGGKRRRRDGPPRRRCDPCQEKLARLNERPSVCKVHGCTRPVSIEREAQLRAWASAGLTDLDADGPLPKSMCEVCREFCRTHDDRSVPCGRPGCEKSWVYKRGAQLQAFLAGRFEDPIRLCSSCESETRSAAHGDASQRVAANVEVMPCIVPRCMGTWHYRTGTKLAPCQDGDQPVERMCEQHKAEHGAPPSGDANDDAPNVAGENVDQRSASTRDEAKSPESNEADPKPDQVVEQAEPEAEEEASASESLS